jgi:hypothetical protein
MDTQPFLPLHHINQILTRHFGSKRALAREAGVSAPYVSNILNGRRRSEHILVLADRKARDWLEWERERNPKSLVAGLDDE